MARIPLISQGNMTDEQRLVYDRIVAGKRGMLVGPLRAALHNPDLADRWQRLGECLRYETLFPPRLSELAILVTARRWDCALEWHIHSEIAQRAGLSTETITALRLERRPDFADADEAMIYDYSRAVQYTGRVDEACYRRIVERFGARGVVELTALLGYYAMVAMTLNAHEIPLPDGAMPELPSAIGDGAAPDARAG